MSTPILSVHGLQKRFRERLLVNIESLVIDLVGVYIFTGINCVGKNTSLKVSAGLKTAQIVKDFFRQSSQTFSSHRCDVQQHRLCASASRDVFHQHC
ncbi:MAG: hypothetical protein HHJ09_12615 [Glaciimonas sp.]|nr:hypothetical protein [Glaciimonas sp.]